ncbi:MAG: hypothetical protein B9S34_00220 [Opitutia bacterium Tous-C1TDCM]|nr:MAG: hypothetical protein B9S34_00220 [Opitutae bacterium Tous-C1TDCM]
MEPPAQPRDPRDPREPRRDSRGQPGPQGGREGRDGRGGRDFRRGGGGGDFRGGRGPQASRQPMPLAQPGPRAPQSPAAVRPAPVSAAVAQAGVPHGATELGWLPDVVWAGEKWENGLAFFADAQGRITRFSREPADLAQARRLAGQAALPGLVNVHAHALQRVLRGRLDAAASARASEALAGGDIFDTARMVFLELLLGGVTVTGEFHTLLRQPDGTPWPEPNFAAREILRAAHDVGLRLALFPVARTRGDAGRLRETAATAEQFVRETELLRAAVERDYPADEAWLGLGVAAVDAVTPDELKALVTYARTQRFRLQVPLPADTAATFGAGRTALAWLAEQGAVDKRFTAVVSGGLGEEDLKVLAAARAATAVCPGSLPAGTDLAAIARLAAHGAGLALGTGGNRRCDLLGEARHLHEARPETAPAAWWQAATVTGARSLGATGGALEVGRPADFFTVNLFDPALAGGALATLPALLLANLERRAIRDVWIGGRQRINGGRHVNQGPIVGRFVDLQKRLWGG